MQQQSEFVCSSNLTLSSPVQDRLGVLEISTRYSGKHHIHYCRQRKTGVLAMRRPLDHHHAGHRGILRTTIRPSLDGDRTICSGRHGLTLIHPPTLVQRSAKGSQGADSFQVNSSNITQPETDHSIYSGIYIYICIYAWTIARTWQQTSCVVLPAINQAVHLQQEEGSTY
ncbi:hypothetical protein VTO42DRAFT_1495 [Malbranchea cinnamomea]